MLNNRGWGIQTMMICSLVLMIALVIIVVIVDTKVGYLFGIEPKDNIIETTNYEEMESELLTATKKYQQKYYKNSLVDDDKIVVTSRKLIEENLLENNKCTGYGIFHKEKGEIKYSSFIKCGISYQTNGYRDALND